LVYDSKNNKYRTLKINNVFKLIAHFSQVTRATKKGDSPNSAGESPSVPRRRLELPRLTAYAPQAYLYTIPTPGQITKLVCILLKNS